MIPKFRVWDKENNKMYGCYGFNDLDWKIYRCNLANKEFRQGHLETIHAVEDDLDNFELMQSTGLIDKNGVEIFEGDIVRVLNHPFQKKEDSAGIEIDGNYLIGWSGHSLTWLAGDLLLYQLKPYIEVVGNRFENPEFLEVEG